MFYELETWRPRPGQQAEHDRLIRAWFDYLHAHHAALFPEWRSARFFRELHPETHAAAGTYGMLFGYADQAGFLAYKERRRDWSGPYAEYKQVDPYPVFIPESVNTSHWQPVGPDRWPAGAPNALWEALTWNTPASSLPAPPAALCLQAVERDTGRPQDRCLLIRGQADREPLPRRPDTHVLWQPAEGERWLAE